MTHRTLSFVLVLVLFACGEGAPTFDSRLPGNSRVSDLSSNQARQLCERAEDSLDSVLGDSRQKRIACVVRGLTTSAGSRSACQATYKDCMKERFDDGIDFDLSCDDVSSPSMLDCTATVREVEDCVTSQLRVIDEILSQIDCGLAEDPARAEALFESFGDLGTSSACVALSSSCPDLFEFSEDDD